MLKRRRIVELSLLGAVTAVAGGAYLLRRKPQPVMAPQDICFVAPTYSFDPASGQALQDAREVPADARCPVCGMFVARHRKWAAQVIFSDGQVQFLDSPLDLFQFLQQVTHYSPGHQPDQVVAQYVASIEDGRWLVAEQAVYVSASRLLGPMRAGNLPAFASIKAARAFIAQQGGQLHRHAELRQSLPRELQQLSPHQH